MSGFIERVDLLLHSIRFLLALWFVAILAVVLILFSVFVYARQRTELRLSAALRLQTKTERLNRLVTAANRDGRANILRFPSDPYSQGTFLAEEDILAFFSIDGEVLKAWGPITASTIPDLTFRSIQREDFEVLESVRLFSATLRVDNRRKVYQFALSPVITDRRLLGISLIGVQVDPENQLPRLWFSLLVGIGVTLLAAFLGGFWLADRAIRPVAQITATARNIGETDLNQRLHLNRKDELGQLADTFDAMLARLQAAFNRQRQFTADASHELRTPLTIVELETSRALQSPRSPAEYQRVLGVINTENQRMIQLVNSLLTLARMDAGQVPLQREIVDLSDLIVDVLDRILPLAQQAGVRLLTGDLPDLPVYGDRRLLTQMLLNLIENGMKYRQSENAWVEISSALYQQGAEILYQISIRDNGQGIAPEHLPHLFDRFYQVDTARTQSEIRMGQSDHVSAGAGLGLAIVQWIVNAHGGRINVESQVGQGTRFTVFFPPAQAASSEPEHS